MDYNSTVNQRIKEKFVAREVLACVTGLVNYVLEKSWDDPGAPFSNDDIGCTEDCPDCEGTGEIVDDDGDTINCYECDGDGKVPGIPEVYEWWMVTGWLAEKLKARGEVVIGDNIWGRQATGQAILLDEVISDICEDMQILDGQKHSWAEVVERFKVAWK